MIVSVLHERRILVTWGLWSWRVQRLHNNNVSYKVLHKAFKMVIRGYDARGGDEGDA